MNRIHRKLVTNLGDQGWPSPPASPASNASHTRQQEGSLASEYQDWARWLDTLRQAAKDGKMPALRALAHGKLHFLLRRSLLLRDNTMLGIRQHAHLAEAASLISEFEQLMGELTGHPMPAKDEWPLPARLYDTTWQASPPAFGQAERRQQPARQNRLDPVSISLALQIHNSLQLTLKLLQQHGSLAGKPAMLEASAGLLRACALGRLAEHGV